MSAPVTTITLADLIAQGFECEHFEAACGDDGDAENGPSFWEHDGYDVYSLKRGDTMQQYVVQDGKIVDDTSYPVWMDEESEA